MPTKNLRVDEYIAKSAPFAQPILKHLRQLVHSACPEVEEKMKWSFPHFDYKGMMCSMAAFKEHCAFGFWKGDLVLAKVKPAKAAPDNAMGQFGRITSRADLPDDKTLLNCIKEAVRLNDEGIKLSSKSKSLARKEVIVPPDLQAALKKNKQALATFESFSYCHKKEYVEWITEAKREETRQKRLATTLEWLAEGKSRNWKYQNC